MKIINESTEWSRFHIVRKDTGETIDSYTDKEDAEEWVDFLVSEGDFSKGDLEIVDSHKKEEVRYPNGEVCRDDSVDMDRALDYQYGTDRDPDNSHYTKDEKQRALTYYIEKHDGDRPLRESGDFSDEITPGDTFIEDGVEYEWVQQYGGTKNLDFDNWAVWEAVDVDSDEDSPRTAFFVVEVDTGFIDWGPCDTEDEAREFLQSKIDDYELDESVSVGTSDQLPTIPGLIAQNNEGELNAIKGYEDLISFLEDTHPEYIPDIEEIIADEKNHVEVLNKILKELDGISPNKD